MKFLKTYENNQPDTYQKFLDWETMKSDIYILVYDYLCLHNIFDHENDPIAIDEISFYDKGIEIRYNTYSHHKITDIDDFLLYWNDEYFYMKQLNYNV